MGWEDPEYGIGEEPSHRRGSVTEDIVVMERSGVFHSAHMVRRGVDGGGSVEEEKASGCGEAGEVPRGGGDVRRGGRGLAHIILLLGCLLSLACGTGCVSPKANALGGGVFRMGGGGRRALQQVQTPPEPEAIGRDGMGRCKRDAVAIEKNPALWIYSSPEGGLPQHGLNTELLVTGGYPNSDRAVTEWKGKRFP